MLVRGLARSARSTSTPSSRGSLSSSSTRRGSETAEPVPERAPAEQVVERLLAVAGDADAAGAGELAERPEQELDLERVGLDQEHVQLVGQHQAAGAPSVR